MTLKEPDLARLGREVKLPGPLINSTTFLVLAQSSDTLLANATSASAKMTTVMLQESSQRASAAPILSCPHMLSKVRKDLRSMDKLKEAPLSSLAQPQPKTTT